MDEKKRDEELNESASLLESCWSETESPTALDYYRQ